ncbi:MAG TPA: iron-sulfur cluster assembly accessory protein [Gammaproteobacteria bacterium]
MSIQLTETAAQRVRTMIEKRGRGLGLRLGTRKSGCSGFAYVVDYADSVSETDAVFESHGVKVIVDADSLPTLDGMELDYVRTNALNEGFEFRNPNVKEQCGCGESFSV